MSDATPAPSDLPAIGTVTDYAGLLTVLRQRADALRVSRGTIDTLAGWAEGYASKLLAPAHPKLLGERSLGLLLEVLGVQLRVVEDPVALAKYQKRRTLRAEWQVRNDMLSIAGRRRREWLFSPERAKQCAALRMAKLSPEKRQKLARRAARARWRRRKAREVAQ
jgi:hypothetical protein